MVDELFEVFEDLFERRGKKKNKEKKGEQKAAAPAAPSLPLFCMACGARNEGGARYCLECGELLPSPGEEFRCARCEVALPLKAKFCPRCGARAG